MDRCRGALEDQGSPPDLDGEAGALWLFAVGSEANRALRAGDLGAAQATYDAIRQRLEASGKSPDQRLGVFYHQLGVVAQDRGDLAAAEGWYRRSLEIEEALGDRPGMASSYHQLGVVAQDRGDLAAAEGWYRRSLEIEEALGNRPGMALTYAQLGLLFEKRGEPVIALDWTVRCVALFPDFPNPQTGTGPRRLVALTASLGMPALEASWQRCTGAALPAQIRAAISKMAGDPGKSA